MKRQSSSPAKDRVSFLKNRLGRLQGELKGKASTAFLIENPIDLFYLTGLQLSTGALFITSTSARLFVDGRYIQVVKKGEIPAELSSEKARLAFLKNEHVQTLIFDSAYTSYQRFLELQGFVQKTIALRPEKNLLTPFRAIKDPQELQKLRASAKLLWKGFLHIKKKLKVGITEKQIADTFEMFCKKHGMEKLAFSPIIAFGESAAMPHYRAGQRKLKKGDIVLIDIGVVLGDYHSDMTRVLFFGKKDPALQKLYGVVHEAQKQALAHCRPGSTAGQLDEAARKVMRREKMEDLYLHGLGHGIGLETHEFPRLKINGEDKDVILRPGMVITIEPGLYIAGLGGVRLETTIIITETGYENLFPEDRGR